MALLSLQKIRRILGWSQSELAEAAQITPAVICNIENGKHRASPKTRKRIEERIGCVDWEATHIEGKLNVYV